MIRLAISVEGQTEKEFVDEVLGPELQDLGIYAVGVMYRAGRGVQGGGNVTIKGLAREMRYLRENHDAVTSLVDFYGFRGKGDRSVEELIEEIGKQVGEPWGQSVFPYIQMHEFEGLLFSNVDAIVKECPEARIADLRAIRGRFPTPEDINDNYATAPSRRIAQLVPGYQKTLHGPVVALEIGLAGIRAECPRFDAWVGRIESLGRGGG